MKIENYNEELNLKTENKNKQLRDKHGRAEEHLDNQLKERESLIKRKSEMKQIKIETVVETANEILERRKQ